MGALALAATLMGVAFALRASIEQMHWLHEAVLDSDGALSHYSETHLYTSVTNFLTRTYRAMAAFTIWLAIDRVWLPWLNLQDVVMGWGDWRQVDPLIRAAVATGWFMALSAMLLSFCLGI